MTYAGLCLTDPHPDRSSDGCPIRTVSSTRFAGRYRLVDFMLSNMVNSGIFTIGMILNSHYQSLIAHIGMGKEWDLSRKTGGVTFFPPYLADERQTVNSELDGPLHRAAEFFAESSFDHLVVVDSSVVYNMDYRAAAEAHRKSGADVTAVYTKKTISSGERDNAIVFEISESGRITGVSKAPHTNGTLSLSLGAYVMNKKTFLGLMAGEKNCGMLRFTRTIIADALERLNIVAHEFRGYSAHVCSVETFYDYNMEMLNSEKRNSLFDFEGRRIYTSRRDSLPTKYGRQAEIKNSLISDGCQIDGTVINSIISRNVRIGAGAVVRNCILQDDTLVEKKANMEYIITDRNVIISENRSMAGYRTYPVYIEMNRVV